jgi:hypothetical protein
MTARAQNYILKSLVQQETDAGRPALSPAPSMAVEKPCLENDAWYVVSTDGSTSVITCKSTCDASKSNGRNQANTEDHAIKNSHEIPTDEPEAGVDLSYLNVEQKTASKLIAGMHAMTVDKAATSPHHEIKMPSAKTDLKEIFKTDRVCMVNAPKVS